MLPKDSTWIICWGEKKKAKNWYSSPDDSKYMQFLQLSLIHVLYIVVIILVIYYHIYYCFLKFALFWEICITFI